MPSAASPRSAEEDRPPAPPRPAARAGMGAAADPGADGGGRTPAPGKRRRPEAAPAAAAAPDRPASTGAAPAQHAGQRLVVLDGCMHKRERVSARPQGAPYDRKRTRTEGTRPKGPVS